MRNSGLVLGAVFCATTGAADPRFVAQTVPKHVYDGGWEHYVGGGLAVFDCDGDIRPDIFAAGGENAAQLMRNSSEDGGDVTFQAETPANLAMTGVIGAYPFDFDSDGIVDLAVMRVGENRLMRGLGGCTFETFAPDWFDGGKSWTTAFSATWEQGQDRPTFAFGNYVDRADPDGPFGTCDQNWLYRPKGDGYDVTPLEPAHCPLSMLFSDWNREGRADLRISNDRHYYVTGGQEQLWAMENTPRLYSEADGWKPYALWGMGIASRDLDFDGAPEVYLTSMGDQRLQRMAGNNRPQWDDAPYEAGATAHRPYSGGDGRPSTGWHVSFGDVQNDGLDDIFVAKGNVEQMPGSAMEDPNNLLLQTRDGTFIEAGLQANLDSLHRARGAALVDFNNDGLLDIAVVNRRAPLEVFRNITENTGNWISIRLQQPAPNRDAVGAFIEVRVQGKTITREVYVGGGHAGGVSGPEHFGLGKAEAVQARVIWPDQEKSDWFDVSVNQRVSVQRGSQGTRIDSY
ncbi:CRTAC1 family protein [Shimia thalassica]|uniref:CRTAC1 family protein n=1 Tax=Shimia thalassica TaxID=1715693 RepID=UPI0027374BE4|nr:CRTAC1 family protein [Shimia thalassica]MDP2578363.1 CRTAC1 family protein [Shimia thalassica]